MSDHEFREKIRERIRKLKIKHLKKFYRKYFSVLPHNCQYNHQQKIYRDSNGKVLVDQDTLKPTTVGLCLYGVDDPTQWKGDLCYLPEHAERCSLFHNPYKKEQIFDKFEEELKNPQIRAEKYKDLNELYLLLEDSSENSSTQISPDIKKDLLEIVSLLDPADLRIKLEESAEKFNLEEYLKAFPIEDLRKVAQMAISLIDQKSKDADLNFDRRILEKEVWEDEDEDENIFPDGL